MKRRIGLYLFSFLILLVSCAKPIESADVIAAQNDLGVEVGTDVIMDIFNYGKLKVKITAPKSYRYFNDEVRTEFPDGVLFRTYNADGKEESSLAAGKAVAYEKNGQISSMYATKDVQVVNVSGEKLNTEKLNWDKTQGRIYTDAFVKISTQDEIIFGKGLDSNQDFTEYSIGKITGRINVKNNDLP